MTGETLKQTALMLVPMTEAMVGQVADIHLDAFRGYMNARMGKGYARGLLRWFCRQERTIALAVQEANGPVLGYVVGAPFGYGKAMNKDLFACAARGLLVRPWLLFERSFRARILARLRILTNSSSGGAGPPDLPEPIMCLVGIGVASAARGRGAGELLMKGFEDAARNLQMCSAYLEVYTKNQAARRLYERHGWQPLPGGEGEEHELAYCRLLPC